MSKDYSKYTKEELIKELEDTTDRLNLLMENMPGGVFVYDADSGKFEFISQGALSIFRCTEEQFKDRFYNNFELMIEKKDRERVKSSIKDQLQFFDSVEITYRVDDIHNLSPIWIYHKARLCKKDDGRRLFYAVISDITEEKLVQESIQNMTENLVTQIERDAMTNLYNKVTMQKEVSNALMTMDNNSVCAMLMIDTDNFKSVNDTFGHKYGDDIIKFVASSIDNNFRATDYKGRMGGDEFMVFMKNTNKTVVEARAKMLNDKIRRDCVSDGKTVHISCSIGIAFAKANGNTYEELFKAADSALYDAKESGKDCFRFA